MSKAIVSAFYGNALDENQVKSIKSFREHAKDIPYYLVAFNRVNDDLPKFCSDNGVKLIDPGHVADIRNHTLTRLQAYSDIVMSEVAEDFVIMVGLDMFCAKDLPLDEIDEGKINVCVDTVAAKDNAKWMTHLKTRLSKRTIGNDFSYVNSGFVGFSKASFGESLASVYEMACTDFYSVAVKDIDCYESDHLNYFLGQMAASEDINVLDGKWNTLFTQEDAENDSGALIQHIIPAYDYRTLLKEIVEQPVWKQEIPAPVVEPVKPVVVNDRKAEYDRKYGHLLIDGKYPPREDIDLPSADAKGK